MTEGRRVKGASVESLADIRANAEDCQSCPLSRTRSKVVFGGVDGHLTESAELMLIGEAPGAEEDQQGRPFLGSAGQELTRQLEAAGLSRNRAYITNVVKCRPTRERPGRSPTNRPPDPTEIEACSPYLEAQIAAVSPRVIVALGATAVEWLLEHGAQVESSRGSREYRGIDVVATFHPSPLSLNRSPDRRQMLAADMVRTLEVLDSVSWESRGTELFGPASGHRPRLPWPEPETPRVVRDVGRRQDKSARGGR